MRHLEATRAAHARGLHCLEEKDFYILYKDLFTEQVLKHRKLRLSSKGGILQQTVEPQGATGLMIHI